MSEKIEPSLSAILSLIAPNFAVESEENPMAHTALGQAAYGLIELLSMWPEFDVITPQQLESLRALFGQTQPKVVEQHISFKADNTLFPYHIAQAAYRPLEPQEKTFKPEPEPDIEVLLERLSPYERSFFEQGLVARNLDHGAYLSDLKELLDIDSSEALNFGRMINLLAHRFIPSTDNPKELISDTVPVTERTVGYARRILQDDLANPARVQMLLDGRCPSSYNISTEQGLVIEGLGPKSRTLVEVLFSQGQTNWDLLDLINLIKNYFANAAYQRTQFNNKYAEIHRQRILRQLHQ